MSDTQILKRNVASQKIFVRAYNEVTGADVTGNAGNISAEISIDGAASAATNDTNPSEIDATDHPGLYAFDLTQAESNGNLIAVTPVSSTASVKITPVMISTRDETAIGTDKKILISTDAQDLSGTLDVNTKSTSSGSITTATFASGAIDAAAIGSNAIDADAIASNAITAAKVATGAITSAKFAAGAINAAAIAADALDADALAATAIAEINTTVDAAISDYFGSAGASLTGIPWNSAWDAEVESEVNDALDTAISELGVGAPTATPNLRTGLMGLYHALVMTTISDNSANELKIHNSSGTVIFKKAMTDNGTIYQEAKAISG